jgi:AcrR family transcriptional regulator
LDLRLVAEALSDQAFERVDMDTIARRLGVAKPTLYRMAGSRDELIALSIDAEAERLLEAIHRDGPGGFFAFAEAAPAGFLLLFGGRYPEARHAVLRVEHMVARSMRNTGPGAAAAAVAFVAAAAALVSRAEQSGRSLKAERLRSDFDDAAKSLARISDSESVQPAPGAA